MMQGPAFDFTINLPAILGGVAALYTMGHKVGEVVTELKAIKKLGDEVKSIDGRVSHIEGHLGLGE